MSASQPETSFEPQSAADCGQPLARKVSQRVLPVLQLTRIALVFTAIADSACGLLLRTEALAMRRLPPGATPSAGQIWDLLGWKPIVCIAVMSIGLYAFGMSLNDIVDRRRDRQFAPSRPLPSGRIGVFTAHLICLLMGLIALGAGVLYASWTSASWMSIMMLVFTIILIVSYDFASKYLVGPGLLTLGLVRFCHAMIPAPHMPLLWQPLLLLNHVAILSTVAYAWEEKRPPLAKAHWQGVLGALGVIDAALIIGVGWIRYRRVAQIGTHGWHAILQSLWISPGLLWPAAALAAFIVLTIVIRWTTPRLHEAGQKLMLFGLLWLIVYDAAFALGYVGWEYAAALAGLGPAGYLSVRLMRAWSKVVQAAPRPKYVRAERTA